MVVNIDQHTLLLKTVTGMYLYCDLRDVSMTRLLIDCEWEPSVTTALRNLIKPGARCVNAGANVGYHTLWMARLAGPSGSVTAVEPSEHLHRLLVRNGRINGLPNLRTIHCAVGASERNCYLTIPEREHGGSFCEPHDYGCARVSATGNGEMISVRPLDDLVKGPVDVMLIDVEGAEHEVWKGMSCIVKDSPSLCMVIEFAPVDHEKPEAWLAEILALGFKLGFVDWDGAIRAASISEICSGGQIHLVARRG